MPGSQGQFPVQNGIHHHTSCLHHRVHSGQIIIQQPQILLYLLISAQGHAGLHGLDMVMVVMAPAPHFCVHALNFIAVFLHQVGLVRLYPPSKESAHCPAL